MAERAAPPAGCGQLEDERARPRRRSSPRSSTARVALPAIDLMVCPPATLLAEFAAAARDARCGSAARTATPSRPAPSPATCRPKCSRTPARAPSSSGIPSGAPTTRRPTRRCAPRRWRPGAPGSWPSSASVRPAPNARRAGRSRWSERSSTARCRTARRPTNLVVAYEPVWAIGTGLTPTPADVAEMHGFIRRQLADALRRSGAGHSHPLRRLGEGVERRGADGRRRRRRRARRRREPQGRGVPGDRGVYR